MPNNFLKNESLPIVWNVKCMSTFYRNSIFTAEEMKVTVLVTQSCPTLCDPMDCMRFTGSQRVRHDWVTELNWTVYWINAWKSHWLNPSKASKQTGRVSFSDDGDPKGSSLFPDPVPRFLGWKGHTAFQLFSKNLYPPLVLNGPETSFISDHPAGHSS